MKELYEGASLRRTRAPKSTHEGCRILRDPEAPRTQKELPKGTIIQESFLSGGVANRRSGLGAPQFDQFLALITWTP